MRRDKNDKQWQAVKLRVTKRDKKTCRFLKLCNMKETLLIQKYAPRVMLECLDHAHIFPVSLYPALCYVDENLVLLNRYSHHNLDDCKHPISGESITMEERDDFWKRIVGEEKFMKLLIRAKGEEHGTDE